VLIVQFTAESLFKILVGVPLAGGFVLLVLVVGHGLPDASMTSLRDVGIGVLTSLSDHPIGFAGFLCSLVIAVLGGSAFTFVVKAGTLAVLVAGERQAVGLERPPLRWSQVQSASAWSPATFLEGCTRMWRRFLRLGLILMVVYAVLAGTYLLVVLGSLRASTPPPDALWPAVTAGVASAAVVIATTVANLFYLLVQMVMAADDVGVRTATGRVLRYLRREGRWVLSVALVVLSVVVVGMGASIVAAGALGLISFVPVVGLAVFPLQAVAWLLRGLLFQFLGLSALGAYLTLYRGES
jgi:hypothetical protein